jgi:D-glycero-alpha-D-manno-heptose-7-phosphate kinase
MASTAVLTDWSESYRGDQPNALYENGMILTRTPLRISFAGGGSDLAEFYEQDYGAVFSTAINKYVYVTVKQHSKLFTEAIRLNYAKTEWVREVDEIENDIARECLRFLEIEPPIYVSTVADLPASTGLGGSSSFCVGLLHALHIYRKERVSAGQLAEEATHIEIDVLKQPIGKQDQYAAAFGGLNLFRFNPGGGVSVEPQRISRNKLETLFDHLMLFWTGTQRDASSVLTEQKKNTSDRMDFLMAMRGQAHYLQRMMSNGAVNMDAFGALLHRGWQFKKQLASSITSDRIDHWYDVATQAGACGGKICGAGAGGFLLFLVKPECQQAVREALTDLIEVRVRPEVQGSCILMPGVQ